VNSPTTMVLRHTGTGGVGSLPCPSEDGGRGGDDAHSSQKRLPFHFHLPRGTLPQSHRCHLKEVLFQFVLGWPRPIQPSRTSLASFAKAPPSAIIARRGKCHTTAATSGSGCAQPTAQASTPEAKPASAEGASSVSSFGVWRSLGAAASTTGAFTGTEKVGHHYSMTPSIIPTFIATGHCHRPQAAFPRLLPAKTTKLCGKSGHGVLPSGSSSMPPNA
jgi:hypothetical protein